MDKNYLIVHKSILPDYLEKVISVRELLQTNPNISISQAVKQFDISRNTYYKYKDYVFRLNEKDTSRKATLSMILNHTPGILSLVLQHISSYGYSVLSISQSLPIHNQALLTLTIEMNSSSMDIEECIKVLTTNKNICSIRLDALE